jgi:hypothetical protein
VNEHFVEKKESENARESVLDMRAPGAKPVTKLALNPSEMISVFMSLSGLIGAYV